MGILVYGDKILVGGNCSRIYNDGSHIPSQEEQ
jgi:hypothetical protein